MTKLLAGWLETLYASKRGRAAVLVFAVLGAWNVGSHVADWAVWTFEPSPLTETGVGTQDSPKLLLAAGQYSFSLDVTGAKEPATTIRNGQTVATCLMTLSMHALSGDALFLPVPESVDLVNGVETSPTLLYFTDIAGTGWYDFYIVTHDGCEWRLTVDKI